MTEKPRTEERRTRADAAADASAPGLVGDSLREKREETEREEGRWENEGGRQERRPVTPSAAEESKMSEEARSVRELMGVPVLTIAEGKRLGSISRLLVRRETRSVEAVGIGGGALSHPRYLRFSQLSTIGADAVMVASEAVLEEGIPPGEIGDLDSSLHGRPVVTESGQKLGEITGFTANTGTGRIEAFRVRTDAAGMARVAEFVKLARPEMVELPDALVVSLGDSALIVRDEATSLWKHDPHVPSPSSTDD